MSSRNECYNVLACNTTSVRKHCEEKSNRAVLTKTILKGRPYDDTPVR